MTIKPNMRPENNSHATVDVLIATYNGADFLPRQLDSIIAQDYPNLRILIRDDASTDATLAVLSSYAKRYPQQITLITDNLGRLNCAGNFLYLLSQSTADYIAYSDQDDFWLPGKITACVSILSDLAAKAQDAGKSHLPALLVHDLKVVDNDFNCLAESFRQHASLTQKDASLPRSLSQLLMRNYITGSASVFNRPLAEILTRPVVDNPCFGRDHVLLHDWWTACVASMFGEIIAIPDILGLYRQHQNNVIGAVKPLTVAEYFRRPYREIRSHFLAFRSKRVELAKALLSVYGDLVTAEQRAILTAVSTFDQAGFFHKRWWLWRYQLWQNDFKRNINTIIQI